MYSPSIDILGKRKCDIVKRNRKNEGGRRKENHKEVKTLNAERKVGGAPKRVWRGGGFIRAGMGGSIPVKKAFSFEEASNFFEINHLPSYLPPSLLVFRSTYSMT